MDKYHDFGRIFPSFVEEKYNYLKIDGLYMASLVITEYPKEIFMMQIIEEFLKINEVDISIFIKKENTVDFLKHITNTIAKSSAEIKMANKNQMDLSVIDNIVVLAKEIREKIQIYNEEVYRLRVYITIYDKNLENLYVRVRAIVNKLYASQIIAKIANFKHKDIYLLTLPLLLSNNIIEKYTHRIVTTSSISCLFPFYVKQIKQNNGIMVGNTKENVCTINLLDEKNINYNMCVFGSSGSGKSYFIKSLIIKNAYKGTNQIIIDPEGEYVDFVENLGGMIIEIDNYNIFYIHETYLQSNPQGFFKDKIETIMNAFVDLKLITEENKKVLRKIIRTVFSKKGLNENVESFYTNSEEKEVLFVD